MIAITWMEIKETFSTAAKNNEILKHKFLPRNIGGKSKKKKKQQSFWSPLKSIFIWRRENESRQKAKQQSCHIYPPAAEIMHKIM